jgi:PAS domain S-box-containing protein
MTSSTPAALNRAEAWFELIVEGLPNAVLVIDQNRRVVLANPNAAALFGYSSAELVGQPVEMLVPDRYREHHPELVRAFFSAPTAREIGAGRDLYGRRKDGAEVPIEIALNPVQTPSGLFIVASIADISERKLADAVRHHMLALVESADDAIISKSVDGVVRSWNLGAERLLGYRAHEIIGRSVMQLIPADRQDEELMILSRILRGERVDHFETLRRRKDGSLVDVSLTISPIWDRLGTVIGASKIMRDITDRKRHAEELRRSHAELKQIDDERNRVGQALKQSEAYLAEAQQLAHTGSWAYDHVLGKVKHYSDEAFRLFGLDPRRPGGPPQLAELRELIHPDDRERVFDELAQVFRDKAEYEQQYMVVLPDQTVRHLHSIGHPVLDQTGELVEYLGTVLDVTERKRAEQRLLVQYRVTRILAEAATAEEAMPKILQAMCECLGWDLGSLWRVDREAGVLRHAELWHAPSVVAPETEAIIRMTTFRPGSGIPGRVWASRASVYIPDSVQDPGVGVAARDAAAREGLHAAFAFPILVGSEVLGVMGFLNRDVWQPDQNLLDMMETLGSQIGQFTKRAAAVDELQLRVDMLQNIPVAAWSVTPDGTPDIVNQLWFEYTGQTPEYVNSYPEAWMGTLHPEDRERASRGYWDGIRSGQGFTIEARFLRARDQTYRWHLNRAVPIRDSAGKVLRFVGTSTDVHDLRRTQEELRETQAEFARVARVMTMGELTASIAHEVNQPLGAMVTSAASAGRWLAAKPPQMDKAQRALERIANDGTRAGAIIQRIRALMKRQMPRKEWLDVNETIREVIAMTQFELHGNDIVLETRLADGLPKVQGDRVQCQQVLLNLLVNAIEAMSEIGERSRELTVVSATDGSDAVRVEVRDTGTGLDAEHVAKLFEPFHTTKAEGLGIGLSVSRSIVEEHGGRLTAHANAPHGAVFCVWLPIQEQIP